MVPVNRTYDVVADVDHEWEGRYQLTTNLSGGTSDTLALYVTRDAPWPVLIGALMDNAVGLFEPRAEITGAVGERMQMTWAIVVDPPGPAHRQRRFLLAAAAFDPAGITTGVVREADQTSIGTFTLQRLP